MLKLKTEKIGAEEQAHKYKRGTPSPCSKSPPKRQKSAPIDLRAKKKPAKTPPARHNGHSTALPRLESFPLTPLFLSLSSLHVELDGVKTQLEAAERELTKATKVSEGAGGSLAA